MYLSITGKPHRVDKQTVADAVHFYAEYLMSQRLLKNIDIDVVLEPVQGSQAYCESLTIDGVARSFEITLDNRLGKRAALMALAHEMVHVKQYATGELKYLSRRKLHRFQGKEYHPQYLYWEQPWEIEAFGRELGLYRMFQETVRKK